VKKESGTGTGVTHFTLTRTEVPFEGGVELESGLQNH